MSPPVPHSRVEERLAALPAWALPASIFAVAFALRAWTLLDERAANPLFRLPVNDDAVYLRLADEVRTGASAGRSWFLAPLHPWFLALLSRGGPPDMALAGWAAAVVGSVTAALAAVAARMVHSSLAGWIAGLLCAAAGVLVFHDVLPGQEPLLALLHVAAFLATVWTLRREGIPWPALVVGVAVGVAMLGRSTSAVLLVAFAAVVLVGTKPRRRAWTAIALAAAGAAVVLVPACFRNAAAVGDFTPFPWSGGPNLYMANGPEARENVTFSALELVMEPEAMARRAVEIAETAEGRKLRPSEVSSWWTDRAWRERGEAGEWSAHLGRKAALFWNQAEVGNNHDLEIERDWSTWLSIVPVTSWGLLALGVAGWWVARRRAPVLDFVLVAVLLTWAALTVFFPLSRYKLPVLPLAAVAGACGLAEAFAGGVRRPRVAVAALLLVVAVPVSRMQIRPESHARTWRLVAGQYEKEGDRRRAIEAFERIARDEPDDGPVLESLGRLLVEDGRPGEGLPYLERAQGDARVSGTAIVRSIYALVLLGKPDRAEAEGRRVSADEMPPALRAEYLANMALAAKGRGERAEAAERLRRAEEIDAALPAVRRARRQLTVGN